MVIEHGDEAMLGHSGSNTMWMVSALVAPSTKRVFVVATNTGELTLERVLLKLLAKYPATNGHGLSLAPVMVADQGFDIG